MRTGAGVGVITCSLASERSPPRCSPRVLVFRSVFRQCAGLNFATSFPARRDPLARHEILPRAARELGLRVARMFLARLEFPARRVRPEISTRREINWPPPFFQMKISGERYSINNCAKNSFRRCRPHFIQTSARDGGLMKFDRDTMRRIRETYR